MLKEEKSSSSSKRGSLERESRDSKSRSQSREKSVEVAGSRKRSSDSKERSSSRVSYIIHCMASHYPKNSVACGIKYRECHKYEPWDA